MNQGKKWMMMVSVFIVMIIIVGCSKPANVKEAAKEQAKEQSSADKATKTDDKDQAAKDKDEALKRQKVTIVTQANDQLNATEAAFKEAYDGEIEIIGVPASELLSKIQMDALSGTNEFDILSSGQGAIQFGLSGIAEELPKLDDWDDIFPAMRENYMFGDKIYGYPVQADTCLLFYRTDLLEEAGYSEPPKTWDEFREMAIKMTTDVNGKHPGEDGFDSKNIAIYGSNYKGGNYDSNTWEFYNYFMQNNAKTVDINYSNNTYEVTVNQKPAVDTLTWLVDNYQKHQIYPKGCINYDWNEFHTMFVEGKVALAVNYAYMFDMAEGDNSKVKGKFAVGLLPKSEKHAGTTGGWTVSLAKGSKKKEAAMRFIKWLASPEGSLIWSDTQGSMPVRESAFKQKIKEAEGAYKMKWEASLENLMNAQSVDLTKLGASYDASVKIMNATVNMALAGEVTPQEAMDSAKKQLEELLKKDEFLK